MAPDLPTYELQRRLREFASSREWDEFHTPKNLAMALAGEAGELLEVFQWITPEESLQLSSDPVSRSRVATELADILIYALRMADVVGIELGDAISAKVELNERRPPGPPDKIRIRTLGLLYRHAEGGRRLEVD